MIDTLKKWVQESERIVFFGGAGVSTEYASFFSAFLDVIGFVCPHTVQKCRIRLSGCVCSCHGRKSGMLVSHQRNGNA